MRHLCDNCVADITDIRVKCAECINFDLCLQCFACGAEIGKHKRTHGYQIINYGNVPIFPKEKGWTAAEEIELLEKVARYGIGNWEKIADLIETKTPEEVENHFNLYLNGNIGQAIWPSVQVPTIKDHTDTKLGRLDIQNAAKRSKSAPISAEDCRNMGYLALRGEFEEEYDDNAEALVSHLSENEDDDDLDKAVKSLIIQMLNVRLKKRVEAKRVVEEYNLVAEFVKDEDKQQNIKTSRSSSSDSSDTKDKLRSFCRFHSSSSHEQLLNNIQRHKKIKARIRELMRYRRNGITKLEDATKFEQSRNKSLKSKENKKKIISSPSSSHRNLSNTDNKKDKKINETPSRQEKSDPSKFKENIAQDLLSRSEKKLCSSLRLKPGHYIALKTKLLKERHYKVKSILHKFPLPSGLKKSQLEEIITFFTRSGWLKNG